MFQKRLQSLPLRTSPKSKRWAEPPTFPPVNPSFAVQPLPRTITPGDSDSDETNNLQQWADEPELLSQHVSMVEESADRDMDMMDTSDQTSVGAHPQSLEPGSVRSSQATSNTAGRMPTPIHCSFAAQVRGNNWSGAAGSALQGGGLNAPGEDQAGLPFGNPVMDACQGPRVICNESVPRSLDGPAAAAQVMEDWHMVQNRRLPSPISESGGEDGCLESPGMVLDSSAQFMGHMDHMTHQHPLLSTLPARASSAGGMRRDASPGPREGTPGVESPNGSAMDVESPATPSPKRGHARSKHTISAWTALQPGMKRTFSIGYRADCEKCRSKVPGHFNHIIVS